MESNQPEQKIENNPAAAESFDKIVAESRANLAEETAKQIKRGPGRPPGAKNVKGREAEAIIEGEATTLQPGQGFEKLDLKPMLKDATKIPFMAASIKFKMPDLEVTDTEVETPAIYLDKLLNFYLPEIEKRDPKQFAFIAWIVSLVLLAVKKTVAALEKRKQTIITVNAARVENHEKGPETPRTNEEANIPSGVDSSQFFNKRH